MVHSSAAEAGGPARQHSAFRAGHLWGIWRHRGGKNILSSPQSTQPLELMFKLASVPWPSGEITDGAQSIWSYWIYPRWTLLSLDLLRFFKCIKGRCLLGGMCFLISDLIRSLKKRGCGQGNTVQSLTGKTQAVTWTTANPSLWVCPCVYVFVFEVEFISWQQEFSPSFHCN